MPWSCDEPNPECPVTPEPAGLVRFWRFDAEDALGGEWHASTDATLRWAECEDQHGGEWFAGSGPAVCGTERLGGHGGSLRLDANGYLEALLALEDIAQEPLTLAAWVSAHKLKQRMTVAYLMRPKCQSAWLDVQNVEWDRSLILSVEKPATGSDYCEVDEVKANLPEGYFDWGQGNWYHIAAIVDAARGHALFVDGRATSSSTAPSSTTTPPATGSGVRIGAGPTSVPGFSGLIDDVALFSRSVAEDELEPFITESTSVRADGQQWTPWSVAGSSTTWKSDCRNPKIEESQGGARVVVKNGYWSAGGLFTRAHAGHNIRRLKKATLVANIPNDTEFDFALGSAHNAERCTWHASGAGKSRYEFDLDGLNHCECPSTCDCRFTVEEARIGSRWDKNLPLDFSVCRVEFEWEEVEADDEDTTIDLGLGPGGLLGLNGWCWRPISYHEHSHVDIDEAHTNAEQSEGTLVGINDTTAYLAADFAQGDAVTADKLCDLRNVKAIQLTADMPQGYSYQLRVADSSGFAREWSRKWGEAQRTQEFLLCDSQPGLAYLEANPTAKRGVDECGKPDNPISDDGRTLNLELVRHVGVQKNAEVAADAAVISIKSLAFTDMPEGNCIPMSGGGTGPD